MQKKEALIFSFFLILFLIYYLPLHAVTSDSWHYEKGIELNDVSYFEKPLLFYLTFFIPTGLLFIVPVACFFGSLLILFRLFREYSLNTGYILFFFLIEPAWMSFLFIYQRETLLFLFSTAFCYCFIKLLDRNEKKWVLRSILFLVLIYFTKSNGQIIIPFLLLYFLICISKAAFFPFIDFQIISNVKKVLTHGKKYAFGITGILANPLYLIQLVSVKASKFKPYVLLASAAVIFISAMGYDTWHVFRYSYCLAPFAFFNMAFVLKELKGKKKKLLLIVLAAILVMNINYFYNLLNLNAPILFF